MHTVAQIREIGALMVAPDVRRDSATYKDAIAAVRKLSMAGETPEDVKKACRALLAKLGEDSSDAADKGDDIPEKDDKAIAKAFGRPTLQEQIAAQRAAFRGRG